MILPAGWRKFVLLVHVSSSVAFLGAVAAFLALTILGLVATEEVVAKAAYLAMPAVTWWVIVPLAVATLVVGVVQSLGTPWGLFRYYWVIVKLVLSIVAALVLLLQTSTIAELATAAAHNELSGYAGARFSMVLHGAGGLLVLLVATMLSVYKPRGLTRFGADRLGQA